jgi:hypothetical protein
MSATRTLQGAIAGAVHSTHQRAKRIRITSAGRATRDAKKEQTELGLQRKRNREYMRRWRTLPENRAKERLRHSGSEWQRRLTDAMEVRRDAEIRRCAYCHQSSVMMIQRLRATDNGFKKVDLPYCGHC